jgi:uncharacterized cupredoxin-like copper-binding protein
MKTALLLAVALVISGCGAGAPTPTANLSTRIDVTLTDQMRIEPDPMTVPAGVPITFVVTNTGAIDHEFTLGDEEKQNDHEREMLEPGAMAHDHSYSILVNPGQTEELEFTFESAGTFFAGCHVPGHYPAGMKATIIVRA